MDYGHTTSSTDPLESFTPDAGDNSFEAENNLDLTNQADEWGQLNEPIEHDKQSLGNTAMNNHVELSMPPSAPEQNVTTLGEVTDYSLQPDAAPKPYQNQQNQSASPQADADIVEASLNPNILKFVNPESIKEEGGRFPSHVVKAMDQIQEEFNNGEFPLDHLPELRDDLSGNYVHHSFKRKTPLKKTDYKEAA